VSAPDQAERHALLGGARLPWSDLERRVRIYSDLAESFLASGSPEKIALGGALVEWFTNGGNLVQLLGLSTPQGSHDHIRAVYRRVKSSSSKMRAARTTRATSISSTP
jgi:hypothetical protein